MRFRLLSLALCAAALTTPAAHGAASEHHGGCGFRAAHRGPVAPGDWRLWQPPAGTWTGEIDLGVAVTSGGAPASASVACVLRVNGVPRETVGPVAVTGVGAAAWPVTFTTVSRGDVADVCTVVDYADGTPDAYDCPLGWPGPEPGEPVDDLLSPYTDPVVAQLCTGDVHVAGEWLVDCPPHA